MPIGLYTMGYGIGSGCDLSAGSGLRLGVYRPDASLSSSIASYQRPWQ